MIFLRILLLLMTETKEIKEIRPCDRFPDCLVIVYKTEITEEIARDIEIPIEISESR